MSECATSLAGLQLGRHALWWREVAHSSSTCTVPPTALRYSGRMHLSRECARRDSALQGAGKADVAAHYRRTRLVFMAILILAPADSENE